MAVKVVTGNGRGAEYGGVPAIRVEGPLQQGQLPPLTGHGVPDHKGVL